MKPLRIGHFSDLHGRYETLDQVTETPDVWVSTGDFFPNWDPTFRDQEEERQTRWFRHKVQPIRRRLRGRPVLVVDGNHDFAPLAKLLDRWGVEAYAVGERPLDYAGWRWGGFAEIPWIRGRWNREIERGDFRAVVGRVFDGADPEILLTHAPPDGILDAVDAAHIGIEALTVRLAYGSHRVRHHFFGHVHETGGQDAEVMGVGFHNSATRARVIEITR